MAISGLSKLGREDKRGLGSLIKEKLSTETPTTVSLDIDCNFRRSFYEKRTAVLLNNRNN